MLSTTGARNATVDVPAGAQDLSRGVGAFTLSLQASREQAQQLSGEDIVGVNEMLNHFFCVMYTARFCVELFYYPDV